MHPELTKSSISDQFTVEVTGLPLSVSDRSFLELYRLRSVYVLKTSLSESPLQSGLLSVWAGKVSHVEWSLLRGRCLFVRAIYVRN